MILSSRASAAAAATAAASLPLFVAKHASPASSSEAVAEEAEDEEATEAKEAAPAVAAKAVPTLAAEMAATVAAEAVPALAVPDSAGEDSCLTVEFGSVSLDFTKYLHVPGALEVKTAVVQICRGAVAPTWLPTFNPVEVQDLRCVLH